LTLLLKHLIYFYTVGLISIIKRLSFLFLYQVLQTVQRSMEMNLRLLQAGGAPPAQRAVHRRITERLVRLNRMLVNGDINVYDYAGSVGGTLKLRNN
jgi:hypothetical protein